MTELETCPHKSLQQELSALIEQHSLDQALTSLRQQQVDAGYIEPRRLVENRYFDYYDADYDITFKAQINYLRHHYQTDMAASPLKKLDCPLCRENLTLPHKAAMRIFDARLANGSDVFFQLTPYPLFDYHFVVIDSQHSPMRVAGSSLFDLATLAELGDDYLACSNSDTAWAGASVLQHHHYQLFKGVSLPIQDAKARYQHQTPDYSVELLHYPIACLRLTAKHMETLVSKGEQLIQWWRAKRENNTFNLLVHRQNETFVAYLILRHPDYRTGPSLQPIKSEGVGVVEVAGFGIYPVPSGENADTLWQQIESDGLSVITGIIRDNNPVAEADYEALWDSLASIV